MDIAEIKQRVLILRTLMQQEKLHFDGAVLFGSRAKGCHTAESDIDLAIISRDFGTDRFEESSKLNFLAFQCIPFCDAVPIGVQEYLDPFPASPILYEIKKHGLCLF
jgi:uncharacterized protein